MLFILYKYNIFRLWEIAYLFAFTHEACYSHDLIYTFTRRNAVFYKIILFKFNKNLREKYANIWHIICLNDI